MLQWDTPVQYIKGVGENRAALLGRLDIRTVGDLLRHYPRDYEDWASAVRIDEAPLGEPCCILATAVTAPQAQRIRQGMVLYKFTVSDGHSGMQVTLFNNRFAADKIQVGRTYRLYGRVTGGFVRREMASPRIEPMTEEGRLHPVYGLTAGLTSRAVEKMVATALEALDPALLTEDCLPEELRTQYGLCDRAFALRQIHRPDSREQADRARRRLAFEELLVLQLGLMRLKCRGKGTTPAVVTRDTREVFAASLPFTLTGAQQKAIADCVRDMQSGHPMSRLIQGDVGSGKTAVAAGAAAVLIQNGWQAAMMAPTEILAEQHARSLGRLLAPLGIEVGLLTASRPAAEKRRTREALADGTLSFVVGTQALLSQAVSFARLGLVITDEQHRFGVAQRAALAAKGTDPHLLVMSATPIPRTLALILYGDLDVSTLRELPPGRQPIATFAVGSDKRERAYRYVRKFVAEGRQAYVVCPLVEQTEEAEETETLAAAVDYVETLRTGVLAGLRIGLLHGKLKPAEKERVMGAFARGELDVLVATTVIEVGVDVPNAVIIVIENAERFGLAQLHQLRGRVGRGSYASTCILISDGQGEDTAVRLRALCRTQDGFEIAEEDLKLRGPGDFFGREQHGLPSLRLSSLSGDMRLVEEARAAAETAFASLTASVPEYAALGEEVRRLWERVGDYGLN